MRCCASAQGDASTRPARTATNIRARTTSAADPPHHLPLAGIDLLQRADALLRHLVADHAVALGDELVEVHPHPVVSSRPLGDDAGLQQRLDEAVGTTTGGSCINGDGLPSAAIGFAADHGVIRNGAPRRGRAARWNRTTLASTRLKAHRPTQKSDRRDAFELCEGLRRGIYRAIVHVPRAPIGALRETLSRRRHFVAVRVAEVNAVKRLLRAAGLGHLSKSLGTDAAREKLP